MRWLLVAVFLGACTKDAPVVVDAAASNDAAEVAPVASALVIDAAVPKPDMELEAKRVLERWDAGYNAHDANMVAAQYATEVRYYGAKLGQGACKEKIAAAIAKAPDQKQSSVLDAFTQAPDGVRITFTRTVTNGEKSKPQRLALHLVKSQSGGLRIDEEGESK